MGVTSSAHTHAIHATHSTPHHGHHTRALHTSGLVYVSHPCVAARLCWGLCFCCMRGRGRLLGLMGAAGSASILRCVMPVGKDNPSVCLRDRKGRESKRNLQCWLRRVFVQQHRWLGEAWPCRPCMAAAVADCQELSCQAAASCILAGWVD